jgi:hypothetical protein
MGTTPISFQKEEGNEVDVNREGLTFKMGSRAFLLWPRKKERKGCVQNGDGSTMGVG